MTDLTLIVNVHDETTVLGPTMRAAEVAVSEARSRGLSVQQLIAVDAASEATTAYVAQARFADWERVVRDDRDLGTVRNALVAHSDGRYIAFLDADDLFSHNWLAEGVATLEQAARRGECAIAHPELNVVFDGLRTMQVTIPDDSPFFAPQYLYLRHCYDSLCLAPREAHEEVVYGALDLANGLAWEDYQWTIETLDAGWHHVIVPDTIIFKRRRDMSLVTASAARRSIVRALPAMAIDRVRDLGRRRPAGPGEYSRGY